MNEARIKRMFKLLTTEWQSGDAMAKKCRFYTIGQVCSVMKRLAREGSIEEKYMKVLDPYTGGYKNKAFFRRVQQPKQNPKEDQGICDQIVPV